MFQLVFDNIKNNITLKLSIEVNRLAKIICSINVTFILRNFRGRHDVAFRRNVNFVSPDLPQPSYFHERERRES